MKCPIDGTQLVMADRGKLDKIIGPSAVQTLPPPTRAGIGRDHKETHYNGRSRKKMGKGRFPDDLVDS